MINNDVKKGSSVENRNEVIQLSNKQAILASFTAISSLLVAVGFLSWIIVNYLVNQISANSDNIGTNAFELSILSGRSSDCEGHQAELRLEIDSHIQADDERMDKIEHDITVLEGSSVEHKGLIKECKRRLWRGQ